MVLTNHGKQPASNCGGRDEAEDDHSQQGAGVPCLATAGEKIKGIGRHGGRSKESVVVASWKSWRHLFATSNAALREDSLELSTSRFPFWLGNACTDLLQVHVSSYFYYIQD